MRRSIGVPIFVLALMLSTGFIVTLSTPSAVQGQTVTSSNGNLGQGAGEGGGQQERQTIGNEFSGNDGNLTDNQFLIEIGPQAFEPPPLTNTSGIPVENATAGNITTADRVHFILQFDELPRAEEREELERNRGITLLEYAGGNAYIASYQVSTNNSAINSANLESNLAELDEEIRSVVPLETADKISPTLQSLVPEEGLGLSRESNTALSEGESISPLWAIDSRPTQEDRIVITIQFHSDVNISDGEDLIKRLGGNITGSAPAVPSVTAEFNITQVDTIAEHDSVKFVDIVSPPLGPQNDGARTSASVEPLHSIPFGLTGRGVTILVYDGGNAHGAHPDFGTRIIESDSSADIDEHATHVAGTVGGSGINSDGLDSAGNPNGGSSMQWRGMAPSVNIRSFGLDGSADVLYDSGGDLNQDVTTAINNGIDLATMSLGNNVVSNNFPCILLGDYTNTAVLIDNIIRGSIGDELIFFQSAGNDRQLGPFGLPRCQQMDGYFTITSPGTAKNSIVVGAINSDNNSVASFSSWGPTDDGRIKPDIVAPGCETRGAIRSPDFEDENQNGIYDPPEVHSSYVGMCGTSMATPVTSGAAALVLEEWYSLNGNNSRPLPSTVKAILIHTAKDIGRVGPDYQHGWGALDAKSAVDLINANSNISGPIIHEEQLDQGDTIAHRFNSDGSSDVKVTLAWDDPSGSRLATRALVNDLDIRLVDPNGVVYEPFVLDPSTPDNPASTGNDNRNNVEMVIGNAEPGTWTVNISGTSVPFGPQIYTLIKPAPDAS
jgi:subtilisin family serine protease